MCVVNMHIQEGLQGEWLTYCMLNLSMVALEKFIVWESVMVVHLDRLWKTLAYADGRMMADSLRVRPTLPYSPVIPRQREQSRFSDSAHAPYNCHLFAWLAS
jgi:hypothetical protein